MSAFFRANSKYLTLIVNKEKSIWVTSFEEQLLPEEEGLSEEDVEDLIEKYQVEYFTSDERWEESEFAVLYLAAINMLSENFLTFDKDDDKISAEVLCFRYFYSRL